RAGTEARPSGCANVWGEAGRCGRPNMRAGTEARPSGWANVSGEAGRCARPNTRAGPGARPSGWPTARGGAGRRARRSPRAAGAALGSLWGARGALHATAAEERAAAVLLPARLMMESLAAPAGGEVRLVLGDVDVAVGTPGRVAVEPEIARHDLAEREGERPPG